MDNNTLILGSPYSSTWSLRAFLCASPILNEFNFIWKEFTSQSKLVDSTYCPTKQVPVLYLKEMESPIVETFAIADVLSQIGGLTWPAKNNEDWLAKSLCLEFQNQSQELRDLIPMELRSRPKLNRGHDLLEPWHQRLEKLLSNHDGQFLMGELSIVDAWFAPLYCRFIRSNFSISQRQSEYFQSLKATNGWQLWVSYIEDLAVEYR